MAQNAVTINPDDLARLTSDASALQLNELAMAAYEKGMVKSGNLFSGMANEKTEQVYSSLMALNKVMSMVAKDNPSRVPIYQKLIAERKAEMDLLDKITLPRNMFGQATANIIRDKSTENFSKAFQWLNKFVVEVKKSKLGATEVMHPPWWARAARSIVSLGRDSWKPYAITLGNTIYYFVKPEQYMRMHELTHVEQKKVAGLASFWAKYFGNTLAHGYTKNPFEISARDAESKMKSRQISYIINLEAAMYPDSFLARNLAKINQRVGQR